ncbi:MAG: response regulator [Prevotella sp.]|nr:response regulator [Prevotella sp.]
MMKLRIVAVILGCLAAVAGRAADNPVATVDSLLALYDAADRGQKAELARRLVSLCIEGDEVVDSLPLPPASAPADSVDLRVWFAADRFYYNTAYFDRALSYIDRAMPLAGSHSEIRATMMSDRAYLLYKTGQVSEATEAAQEAVKYAQQEGRLLQQSRAYLYLACINISLRLPAEATDFVEKAIETNARLGLNNNTHNALGIACEVYSFAGDTARAIDYGWQAVEAAKAVGSSAGAVNHLSQISYAYNRQGDYERGLQAAQQAIDLVNQMAVPDRNLLAISLVYKAHNLLDLHRNHEAADALRQAISIEEQEGNTRAVCYDLKALHEALLPYDEHGALEAITRYAQMADSLHMADLHEALGKANAEFRNAELQEQSDARARTSRIILFSGIAVVALMLVALAFLLYAIRLKNRSNQQLLSLQRTRENFFTNITHEFRTPLTVILGKGRQLQADPSEAVSAAGTMIEREGSQLLALINQLLDLSKVQANVAEPDWRTDNIVPYLSMIVETFYDYAHSQGIELIFAPRENEVTMDFVPDYVMKMVNNLVSNALKFTPKGGHVRITTRREDQHFLLQVADDGCGIDRQHQQHIFEPFYQAGDDSSAQGTGVGLALVRQIITAVGGSIEVDSSPGHGSIFTVTMPVTVGQWRPLTDDERRGLAAFAATGLTPSGNAELIDSDVSDATDDDNVRLLVIEDNRDVAYYIGSLFRDRYEIFYATNGRIGFEKAREIVPDLIITDLMMPEVDGLQFCRMVRASEVVSHVPVIVITARTTSDDLIRGIEAGADAYLYKPFNAQELTARVEQLLETRRLLREKFSRMLTLGSDQSAQDGKFLSRSDAQFIGRLTDLVCSLMGRGQSDVDTIAQHLNMSTGQLRRKVGAITGRTPATYILQIRLANAQRLLDKHPELSISDVAYRTGFSDVAHFSHAFQKAFDMSPSQWARRAK